MFCFCVCLSVSINEKKRAWVSVKTMVYVSPKSWPSIKKISFYFDRNKNLGSLLGLLGLYYYFCNFKNFQVKFQEFAKCFSWMLI